MAVSSQETVWFDDFELHGHGPTTFTSLVVDDGDKDSIANSMQLVER